METKLSVVTDWRNLRLFLLGQFISSFGTLIQKYSVSLYVLNKTGSSQIFTILMVITTLPGVLFGPLGGVLGDRRNKRNSMIFLDFLSSAILFVFVLLFTGFNDNTLLICICAFLLAVINAFYFPVANGAIPFLAAKEDLVKANSYNTATVTISNVVAPIVAGFLSSFLDIKKIMILSAIAFFSSALVEIIMQIDESKPELIEKVSVWEDMKIGLVYVKEHSVIKSIIICSCVCNLLIMPIYSVTIPYIVKIICLFSDAQYGQIEAGVMAGMIVGTIVIGLFAKKVKLKNILGFSIITIGVGMAAMVALLIIIENYNLEGTYRAFLVLLLICFVVGCVISVMSISLTSLTQSHVEREIYSRISSLVISISNAIIPLGQVLVGAVMGVIYTPLLMGIISISLFGTGIYYLSQKTL